MPVAAALLAFIKAIPSLEKIYLMTVELYFKQQEAADQSRYDEKKTHRDALILAMGKDGVTEDELKNIRRALYDLNRR